MKTILIAFLALVVIGGGYYWYQKDSETETPGIGNEEAVEENVPTAGKLDIRAACESALAYMTFEDGEAAAEFVSECEAGEHPEVIERYKADMNLGAGAAV